MRHAAPFILPWALLVVRYTIEDAFTFLLTCDLHRSRSPDVAGAVESLRNGVTERRKSTPHLTSFLAVSYASEEAITVSDSGQDFVVELAQAHRNNNVDVTRSLFQRTIFAAPQPRDDRSLWDRYHILPLGVRISPDIPKLLSTAKTVGELQSVLRRVLGSLFFLQHETAAHPLPDVLCKPGLVCEHPSPSPLLSSPQLSGFYSPSPAPPSQNASPARTSRLPFKAATNASRRLELLEETSTRPIEFDSITPLGMGCVRPAHSCFLFTSFYFC